MLRKVANLLSIMLLPPRVVGRQWLSPRGASQLSSLRAALTVCEHSCHASVGRRLESFTENWGHITSDVFVRNVRHGYSLEFAEGNTPPLSRVPFSFNRLHAGADQELLSEAVQKLMNFTVGPVPVHATS